MPAELLDKYTDRFWPIAVLHERQQSANSRPYWYLENRGLFNFYGRYDLGQAAWRYYRTQLGRHHEAIPLATSYVVTLVIMSGAISDCATIYLLL